MKRFTVLLAFLLFAFTAMQAQSVQITGNVTSADDGSPLPGVSVVVKGTTVGTVTDVNGDYVLAVPRNATTLVFSFVGMSMQEVTIGDQTVVNVVMESDALQLDEVVVTALGITRERKSLGYAVESLSSEEISRAANPNIMQNISGKMAGVEVRQSSGMPGAPSTVFIRGARSFSGNNQPLLVVDGMPIASNTDYGQGVTEPYYSSRSIDLDPNDIESMTVLKGQAAAALYGLRASNGVIVITTKSGRSASKGNPTVDITTSYTADAISRFPDVQQTWAQGYYEDFYSAYSFSWGPKITDLPSIPVLGGDAPENAAFGQTGKWWDPYKGSWQTPTNFNNAKNFFETGNTFYTGVNISNSNDLGSFLVGFSRTDQTGVIPNTGMQRSTAKANGTINLGSKWKAGFSANYSDVNMQKIPSGNNSILFTVIGAPASFDLMGTPYHMDGPLGEYRQISYRRGAVGENPVWAVNNNYFHETTRRVFGNSYLEYNPTTWINVRYQLGIDTYGTDNEDLYQAGSSQTGQVLPTAGDYTNPNKTTFGYRAPTGGSINNYGINRTSLNSLLNVTITRNLTEDLRGTLILGNEVIDNQSRSWTMLGTGFVLPGWNNMSNTTTQTADESKATSRTVGSYGNLSLDYKDLLFFNATGRYDIVSTMPRDNRSFFYPSVSLAMVLTELAPLQDNSVLSYSKVRGSFAQVGQAGTWNDLTYGLGGAASGFLVDGIQYPFGGVSGFRPSTTVYNPGLVPQNTFNYEFGIDFKFFNNRVGLEYTYSYQNATDQIFAVPMAGSTGYASYVTNAGEMTTVAHELVTYVTPVKTNNFEWTIQNNFTTYKSEVEELAPGIESVALAGFVTPNVRAYAGNTYPTIYGTQLLRDDNGNILIDDDPDSYYYGMPMSGETGKIGDVTPDFWTSFTNTFSFKFITLSAQLDWKKGGDIYSGTNRLMGLYGSAGFTEDRTTPFQYKDTENAKGTGVLYSTGEPNNITRGGEDDLWAYPDFYADLYGGIDEMAVYDNSYVKLREVALTIALPKKLISPLNLDKASLSLVGRNFLLWSNLPNVDPETSQGIGNGVGGFDYVSLPHTSSYGVTLNLTF